MALVGSGVQGANVLSRGDAPSVLLDTDDSVVFVVLELTLIAVSVLLFVIWRPFAARRLRG